MAIKGGDLLHVGGTVLIERAQTAGPGQVNLSPEKVYELGNYLGLATIFDIPDLSFSLESLDATAQFEAILTGTAWPANRSTTTTASGTAAGTVITDTAGAFTAADVNTGFILTGAGTAGALLYGTIVTVTDSTHVVITPAIVTTVAATSATYGGVGFGGTGLNLATSKPLDVLSEIKNGVNQANPFQVAGSAVIPYLNLESVSYDFGVKTDAKQTASLKGDSLFYNPAGSSAYVQNTVGTNTANQVIVLTNVAYPYNGAVIDGTKYVLAARLKSGQRLFYGADYTEAVVVSGNTGTVTVTILVAVPTTDTIILIYASSVVASYVQSVHQLDTSLTPAALRGKDIEVFINGVTLASRFTSVQSVTADWKVTLDQDREFSNTQLVSQDFFVPDVSGTVVVKPRNYADLYNKVAVAAGLATSHEVAGAITTVPLPMQIVLHSPDSGVILKTIYVPDARFTLPGFSGQVQQKLIVTFNWSSDTGAMTVFRGQMPSGPA
jgi:hypothetical protein